MRISTEYGIWLEHMYNHLALFLSSNMVKCQVIFDGNMLVVFADLMDVFVCRSGVITFACLELGILGSCNLSIEWT